MPETLEPLGDRVLVRRHEEKTANKHGLLMPDGAKEKPAKGTVVSVGNGRKLDNGTILRVDLEPGHIVVFGKFSGSEFNVSGETLLIMREDEIIARVSGEADPEAEPVNKLERKVSSGKAGDNELKQFTDNPHGGTHRIEKKRKRK